jgi:hypothetical protein
VSAPSGEDTRPRNESPGEDLESEARTAEKIAEQIMRVPGVYSLGRGRLVEAATYGRGKTVRGVVVESESVTVHIIAEAPAGLPLPELAERVRRAVTPAPRVLDLVIEDLHLPEPPVLPGAQGSQAQPPDATTVERG